MKGYTNAHGAVTPMENVTVNVSAEKGEVSGYKVSIVNVEFLGSKKYERVEYIESDATQYIDTGFKPNQNTKVVMDTQFVGVNESVTFQAFFGANDGGQFSAGYHDLNGDYYVYCNSKAKAYETEMIMDRMTVSMDGSVAHIGDSITLTYSPGEFRSTDNLYLFARNMSGTASYQSKIRVYGCQIYDNGVLIRDYIPAVDNNGVAGLYDSVNDSFVYSRIGSAFATGVIIGEIGAKVNNYGSNNEYIEVEYIESTGSQYINTGFKPNQNTRLVMDFENIGDYSGMTTSLCPLFGARNASSSAVFTLWIGSKSYPHYGNVAYNKNGRFSTNINSRLIYDFNKNVASIGSNSITCTAASFTTNYNLCILGANTGGTIDSRHPSGKLYSCQIYDNGVLVRDYVPVVKTNGVAGLYDKVNNVFYLSNGSTNFIAGDVIGEAIAIQTTSSASYKIPYGTSYMVKASDVNGYTTPSEQSFTASQPSRNVSVMYKEAPYGVSVVDINGSIVPVEDWNAGSDATGIVLVTDNVAIIVALETWYSDNGSNVWNGNKDSAWGGDGKLVTGIKTTYDEHDAITDFDGEGNTDKIIAQLKGTRDDYSSDYTGAPAAEYCRAYSKGCKGVGEWYLPSAGELNEILLNEQNVSSAMMKVAGFYPMYSISSTQYSQYSVWLIDWENRELGEYSKSAGIQVLPICKL